MSFLGGGSSGGGQTQTQTQQPYAPAQPALNQIISEAGKIYQQGPAAAGYVAPTAQTTAGLAGMETMATAAQQQLADTLSGKNGGACSCGKIGSESRIQKNASEHNINRAQF